MSRFTAQTLELAIAHFPAALLPAGGAEALRGAASYIAPGRQLYFECRLAGDARAIDVSQHFFADGDGPDALRMLCAGRDDDWERLARFAHNWNTSDALSEIGLEQDQAPNGGWVTAPAIFAAFRTNVLEDRTAAADFVTTVVPDAAPAWRNLIDTLETAERHGLEAGRMIGSMLSRDGQLRCMVRGVEGAQTAGFLEAIGWPGDRTTLLALLAEPLLAATSPRLVLGFAPGLVAECGIECIPGHDPAGVAALDALLEWLVERGLAERGRVAALRDWPAAITPIDARAEWPDAMVARHLTGRPHDAHFSGFINHVKLNLSGGRVQPAKAYLSLAPVPNV